MAIIKDKFKTLRKRVEIYSARAKRVALHIWCRWRSEVVFISGGVALVVFLIILFWGRPDNTTQASLNDMIRTALLGLGGLDALYGLVLGAKRSNNAQAQLFNDRLGRGVELLANESVTLRVAGVRLLDNLAETANIDQTKLIVELLHDFVRTEAKIDIQPHKQDEKKAPLIDIEELSDRIDIVLSIKTIQKHRGKTGKSPHEVGYDELDLRKLNLSFMDLEQAIFSHSNLVSPSNLEGVNFTGTNLDQTEFREANLHETIFWDTSLNQSIFANAEVTSADFWGANLKGANLVRADLTGADFGGANAELAIFSGACLSGTKLKGANLNGADISNADLSSVNKFEQTQLNQIIKEAHQIPYNIPEHLTLPEDRAYVWEGERRRFVKSDKDWSEQWIDD